MAKTVDTPIFYEALAGAAHCTPADAVEHLADIAEMTDLHQVDTFLAEYAA